MITSIYVIHGTSTVSEPTKEMSWLLAAGLNKAQIASNQNYMLFSDCHTAWNPELVYDQLRDGVLLDHVV